MSRILFNVAAKTDKAGRQQNEDAYWVCPDIAKGGIAISDIVNSDQDVSLGMAGALFVVADGMGGANAGEVASDLVIKTVQNRFLDIPADVIANESKREKFVADVIIDADKVVKQYAGIDAKSRGLGSTVALAWLMGDKLYCGWVGDSRIYRFNCNTSDKLVRLSHDHSFVQNLVDTGRISEDEAFDHPDGNIITRSMGDSGEAVNPETRVYNVYKNDVIILCSDGISGRLPDKKIEDIVDMHQTSSIDTLNALWEAADDEGFTDNATIEVVCIADADNIARGAAQGYPKAVVAAQSERPSAKPASQPTPRPAAPNQAAQRVTPLPPLRPAKKSGSAKGYIIGVLAALMLIALGAVIYLIAFGDQNAPKEKKGKSQEYEYYREPTEEVDEEDAPYMNEPRQPQPQRMAPQPQPSNKAPQKPNVVNPQKKNDQSKSAKPSNPTHPQNENGNNIDSKEKTNTPPGGNNSGEKAPKKEPGSDLPPGTTINDA